MGDPKITMMVRIDFANRAVDVTDPNVKKDMNDAIKHASKNLDNRFNIKIYSIANYVDHFTICLKFNSEEDKKKFNNIGNRLRGIANYLLKNGTAIEYTNFRVGNRLLYFYETDMTQATHIEKDKDPYIEIIQKILLYKSNT